MWAALVEDELTRRATAFGRLNHFSPGGEQPAAAGLPMLSFGLNDSYARTARPTAARRSI